MAADPLTPPPELLPLAAGVEAALERVDGAMRTTLDSALPDVADLCRHVERYRGKMLRPRLVLLSHAAAGGLGSAADASDEAVRLAATFEMIHLATLIHDDVLDEAEVRRAGRTINAMEGNEVAVILGDYLIAAAYYLCSSVGDAGIALDVARVCMDTAEGEILQLSRRRDWSVDEATYERIVGGKTGALIAASCGLGGRLGGADGQACEALRDYGRLVGIAFQIQDDLLDLLGEEDEVGKSVGKDLEKGKLTLPLIHHLATIEAASRGRVLALIERAATPSGATAAGELARAIRATGSVEAAQAKAFELVDRARERLAILPESEARQMLDFMALAAVRRTR
ncbi:MAG: polyprenyl synthetase family protein [Planctomycetota bacterium]